MGSWQFPAAGSSAVEAFVIFLPASVHIEHPVKELHVIDQLASCGCTKKMVVVFLCTCMHY